MEIESTPIEGVLLIKPKVWGDERGYFVETWQEERYRAAGIVGPFVQDNHSMSTRGILRGLHFQKKHPQGKLVSVSLGSVFDVAVDIRPDSPTFGKWFGAELTQQNQWQMWIAPGLAHGFAVTSDTAHFHYYSFHTPQHSPAFCSHGYRDGIRHGHFDGTHGRHRHHPQEHVCGAAAP